MRRRLFGLMAVIAMVAASCGGGSAEESGALVSGIGVHGAWTIDVINPDGSVDDHVEFSNDLLPSGVTNLARFLTSGASPGQWSIALSGSFGNHICDDAGIAFFCEISETATIAHQTTSWLFDGLSVDASDSVVLSGTVQASRDGNIGQVTTNLSACSPSVSADSCVSINSFGGMPRNITRTSLSPAIDVVAGQTVQVEVVLSFGTLP